MEEKKELLNEERHQKVKGVIAKVALIIVIVGVLIGGSLIATGVTKMNAQKAEYTEKYGTVEDMEKEVEDIENQLVPLKAEKNKEFKANGFSEKYYELDRKIEKLEDRKIELESEVYKQENGFGRLDDQKFVPLFIIGAFIIIASCMVGGAVFMFSKRREMMAYMVQDTLPLVEEAAPKVAKIGTKTVKEVMPDLKDIAKDMAPMYGDVAKEISKGIKEVMSEAGKEDK